MTDYVKNIFEELDIKDGESVYIIHKKPEEKGFSLKRVNCGFSTFELYTILDLTKNNIIDMIKSGVNDTVTVEKKYIKQEEI